MKKPSYRDKRFCAECAQLYCRLLFNVWKTDQWRVPRVQLCHSTLSQRSRPEHRADPGMKWCATELLPATNHPALPVQAHWPAHIQWKWLVHWVAHVMTLDTRHDRLFNDHHKFAKLVWRMFFTNLIPGVDDLELHVAHRALLREDHCDVARLPPREHPLAGSVFAPGGDGDLH